MPTGGFYYGPRNLDPRKSMNKKQRRAFYHGGNSPKKKFRK